MRINFERAAGNDKTQVWTNLELCHAVAHSLTLRHSGFQGWPHCVVQTLNAKAVLLLHFVIQDTGSYSDEATKEATKLLRLGLFFFMFTGLVIFVHIHYVVVAILHLNIK